MPSQESQQQARNIIREADGAPKPMAGAINKENALVVAIARGLENWATQARADGAQAERARIRAGIESDLLSLRDEATDGWVFDKMLAVIRGDNEPKEIEL